jgi:transaldolase
MADLAAVGIDYDDVVDTLEREGVEKFAASWNELLEGVTKSLEAARSGADRPNRAAAGAAKTEAER